MSEAITSEPLGQNINVLSGFAFPSAGFNQLVGLPLIRIRDLGRAQTEVRFSGQYDPAYLIQNGDILIGMDGDFEVHRWSGDVALLNQRVCKVEAATRQVDQSFLYWYLKPRVAEVHRRTPQTTVRHLSARDLYLIPMPPIPALEQVVVAQVLDTLDTAIHETEAIIAKLKAVKQGLLHDLLTRGIDANGELRPPQSEAPHLYKPSPLGWIPKEWQVAPLSSRIASLDAGVSVNSEDRPHGAGEIGVLKTSALSQGKFLPDQNKAVVASEISLVREPVLGDSILVSRMNTPELVGESCYVSMPWPTLFLPDRIWQLKKRSPDTVDMQWLSCVFLTPYYRVYVQMHATGTSGSMKNLPKSRLLAMPVAFPGTAEQSAIAALVDAADSRIATEASALEKLRAQKSGLMDDLLTGRVRVTPLLQGAQHA